MYKLLALALFLIVIPTNAQTISVADCTVLGGCKVVTDLIPTAVPDVDVCDLWSGAVKLQSQKYVGLTHGCVWMVPIPDGETRYLEAVWIRSSTWEYSYTSNMLILTSKAAVVPPPPPSLLPAPQNLRVIANPGGAMYNRDGRRG